MTTNEALDLDFNEYMNWCHQWCREKANADPIFQDVYLAAEFKIIEAGWARRYWYHKNGVEVV